MSTDFPRHIKIPSAPVRSNLSLSRSNTLVQHSLLFACMFLAHLETDMLKIERCAKPTFRDMNSEVLAKSLGWRD